MTDLVYLSIAFLAWGAATGLALACRRLMARGARS